MELASPIDSAHIPYEHFGVVCRNICGRIEFAGETFERRSPGIEYNAYGESMCDRYIEWWAMSWHF